MEHENNNTDSPQSVDDIIRRGTILVSSPLLQDPNFKHTAVLILDQDMNGGHIGLVLNRPLDMSLADISDMPGSADNVPLQNGGPVDLQRLFWIHTLGEALPGALEILPGLYIGGDYDALIKMFVDGKDIKDKIRFYLGYSGWGKDQLEKEVQMTAWGVLNNLLDPHLLFDYQQDEMWHKLCLLLGPDYRHWGIFPADPTMN